MYVENKDGNIDGVPARIGRVRFSKSGLSVFYRGREFQRLKGGGVKGNYFDVETGDEYWISGLKQDGDNRHYAKRIDVEVDPDVVADVSGDRRHDS